MLLRQLAATLNGVFRWSPGLGLTFDCVRRSKPTAWRDVLRRFWIGIEAGNGSIRQRNTKSSISAGNGPCSGEHGFRTAADGVEDPELKRLFLSFSALQGEFASEIEAELVRLGKDPAGPRASRRGAAPGLDLCQGRGDGEGRRPDRERRRRGEDVAVKNFREALQKGIPATIERMSNGSTFRSRTRTTTSARSSGRTAGSSERQVTAAGRSIRTLSARARARLTRTSRNVATTPSPSTSPHS